MVESTHVDPQLASQTQSWFMSSQVNFVLYSHHFLKSVFTGEQTEAIHVNTSVRKMPLTMTLLCCFLKFVLVNHIVNIE